MGWNWFGPVATTRWVFSAKLGRYGLVPQQHLGLVSILAAVLVGVLILAFILVAFRDLGRLRTGISRAWAIGRTAFTEAWSARIWAIYIIWLGLVLILAFTMVRGYGPADEMRMYLTIFLRGQVVLLLLYLGILACMALPRERERRTLITTGSKPISRLELLLGKVLGLSTAALVLVLAMMVTTWGFMTLVNAKIRHDAGVLYAMQKRSYDQLVRHVPPEPGLRYLARHGVLQASNNLRGRLRIAGLISYATNPPQRELKGGSAEKLLFQFPSLPATWQPQAPPLFIFHLPPFSLLKRQVPKKTIIHVTLTANDNPLHRKHKVLTLNADGDAVWQPSNPYKFFSFVDPRNGRVYDPGPVTVGVTCPTLGDYLLVGNGRTAASAACKAWNMDPNRVPGHLSFVLPQPDPRIFGFMKSKHQTWQEIAGATTAQKNIPPEVASMEFRHLQASQVPIDHDGNFTVDLLLGVNKHFNEAAPAKALIRAYAVDNPRHPVQRLIRVEEKHVTTLKLPATLLDGSSLIINLQSAVPGLWIKLRSNSITLARPPSPFIANLGKSELIIFCETVLLISIGVAAGTCLGWPVALLVTAVCYLLGSILEFIHRMFDQISQGFSFFHGGEHAAWSAHLGWLIRAVMVRTLYFLVHVVPDFTRFDPTRFIVQSVNMPWAFLGWNLLWTVIFVLPTLALGYLLLRRQELA